MSRLRTWTAEELLAHREERLGGGGRNLRLGDVVPLPESVKELARGRGAFPKR